MEEEMYVVVVVILDFDMETLFFEETFLTPRCSHTPEWKLVPHLFLKLSSLNSRADKGHFQFAHFVLRRGQQPAGFCQTM